MALSPDKPTNDHLLYCSIFSYDLFLRDYYVSSNYVFEELLMLFLLRFRIISRKQVYSLGNTYSVRYIDKVTGLLAKGNKISRLMGDSAESTASKSIRELYYSITLKGSNDFIFTAETLYSAWVNTTAQKYTDERILRSGAAVIKGVCAATNRVSSHFCHTSYSRSLFIEYIKSCNSSAIFEYQDEVVYGAGRYYSFYDKRATGVNIHTKAVRSDSVLKIECNSNGIKENLFIIQELDTTKQRLSIIEQKLLRYTGEVFDSWPLYERHMPILCFNIVTADTSQNNNPTYLTKTEQYFLESLLLSGQLHKALAITVSKGDASYYEENATDHTLRSAIKALTNELNRMAIDPPLPQEYSEMYSSFLSRCIHSLNSMKERFPMDSSLSSLYHDNLSTKASVPNTLPYMGFSRRFLSRYRNIEKAVLANDSLSLLALKGLSVCVIDNNNPDALHQFIPSVTPFGDKILSVLAEKYAVKNGIRKDAGLEYTYSYSPSEEFHEGDSLITFRNVYRVNYIGLSQVAYAVEDYAHDFLSRIRIIRYISEPKLWGQIIPVCLVDPLLCTFPSETEQCKAIIPLITNREL